VYRLFADGRNQPKSNYEPRALGSSNSRILKMIGGSHHGVHATREQAKMLRLWIDAGATYPGAYAALASGMIGNYIENNQVNTGADWPETKAAHDVINRRCNSCHNQPALLLPKNLADEREVSFWMPSMDDPRLRMSRHIVWNLSRPEKSLMLLAPLAEAAGGFEHCRDAKSGRTVFENAHDPDYKAILALAARGKAFLDDNKRFDMAGFTPRREWLREMQRYGILPATLCRDDVKDAYVVEQDYWRSLWQKPCSN
jgi:hypothetical protein